MSDIKRVSRLVRYFERRKEEAALQLAATRARVRRAEIDLADLRGKCDEINNSMYHQTPSTVDIVLVRMIGDYKALLQVDIDRKRLEIETLRREEGERYRAATDAYRHFRVWENVKDKRIQADMDLWRRHSQRELDELSLQRKQRAQS